MDDASVPVQKREKPSGQLAAADPAHDRRRRLVVCLDGSWNTRDSGTNIYHLSNLTKEGAVGDGDDQWFQMVYYDEGVGTGLLDRIRGGAFGVGLSENIREAYDWLVEKYRDGDEIYVFGFSRGAFTARSLVGLIAKCGLLYRGAPLSPAQLWRAYRILGRHPDARTGSVPPETWMERIVGRPKRPFRPIRTLKRDSGEGPHDDPPIEPPANRSEELLAVWSRRVPITCLGVFDTVASMGLDALALPWLRDRTAQFHDTKLSSLVVNGFQALAIDENRSNFAHVSWHRAISSTGSARGKIEQRWFIGAHGNIGGGTEDDVLAQFSLSWLMRECAALGLVFRPRPDPAVDPALPPPPQSCIPLRKRLESKLGMEKKPAPVADPYATMGGGIWKGLIRSKRKYRRIAPPPEFQNGKPVQSLGEQLDGSVVQMWTLEREAAEPGTRYDPPNLWEYRHRAEPVLPPPPHCYWRNVSLGWLALWLVLVGGAAAAFAFPRGGGLWYGLVLGAMLFGLAVDWGESAFNHAAALEPDGPRAERRKAFVVLLLFVRLLILAGIVAGIISWVRLIWPWLTSVDWTPHLGWLLFLYVAALCCQATANWTAAPMAEAGFGSILRLQWANSPGKVVSILKGWLGADKGLPSKELFTRNRFDDSDRRLLMPVVHTIWRDLLAFIPAYSLVIFFAAWLVRSLFLEQYRGGSGTDAVFLLIPTWAALKCALALAVTAVLLDLIEDVIHLHYIRKFPEPPAPPLVWLAFGASCAKFLLLGAGLLVFVTALVWLFWLELPHVFARESAEVGVDSSHAFTHNAGALGAIIVLLPPALVLLAIVMKLRSRKKEPTGSGPVAPILTVSKEDLIGGR